MHINSVSLTIVLLSSISASKPLGRRKKGVCGNIIYMIIITYMYNPVSHLSMLLAFSNCPNLHLATFTLCIHI